MVQGRGCKDCCEYKIDCMCFTLYMYTYIHCNVASVFGGGQGCECYMMWHVLMMTRVAFAACKFCMRRRICMHFLPLSDWLNFAIESSSKGKTLVKTTSAFATKRGRELVNK